MYTECPNADCQGLVHPADTHVTTWRTTYQIGNRFPVRTRSILIYCETCRSAFEIMERTNETPKFRRYHADSEPLQVAKIRRRINLGNVGHLCSSPDKSLAHNHVDCYA